MNGTTVACAAATLEVVVGGRHVTVAPTQRFVLGRGAGVDLVLDHPRVSRRHLILNVLVHLPGPPPEVRVTAWRAPARAARSPLR
ncbi:FHA domain-containing protein [Pseudonocardia charpentierae]|uniref:FHA domain-containing protein n=1 Tax=Pseudonocardia charpentierae TaxID=3075545 RepID=UPI0037C5C067